MNLQLRIFTSITTHGFATVDPFYPLLQPGTELSHVEIDHGPASIESDYDEMLAESIASLGLRHSKMSWPFPPQKRIAGYEFLPRQEFAPVG